MAVERCGAATARFPRYAAPEGTLHWRRWDEDMVVFDTATGSTHLLSPVAAEVLLTLLDGPEALDAARLAQRLLADDDGTPLPEAEVQALQSVLLDLTRLGLVNEEASS